jgi:type IX secretion system PorP/SprF family membrane protein
MSWASMAQDYHFSQFMPNMVHVNPAVAALTSSSELGLTYRNQWPGIPATFITYGASALHPVKALNSGIGVCFMNDMQGSGVISRTSATLLYGYHFQISSGWQIGTGIGASYVFKKFNADELLFRSDILNDLGYSYTQTVLENYTRSYPDFNIGIIATNNSNFSFGFSASHLTQPKESLSDRNESRLPLKYTAFVSGRISGDTRSGPGYLAFEPALFFSRQQQNHELIWGSQVLIAGNFMLGGWIRQNLNFNFEAMIISAGISWEHYNISYSYDVNLKKLNFISTKMAAHEVTFLYRFEYNDRKFKKIECPAYL